MYSNIIGQFAIIALMFLAQLGNFWITYGIWPVSWWSYFIFFFINIALYGMWDILKKEK